MSASDPLASLTFQHETTRWIGRVWFTPKHEIRVVFDQWDEEPTDLPEQQEKARELYEVMRRGEWEFRLAGAAYLAGASEYWDALSPPEPEELARRMVLVEVVLFGDRSGHLTYHTGAPFEADDIEVGVGCDGAYDGVILFPRDE